MKFIFCNQPRSNRPARAVGILLTPLTLRYIFILELWLSVTLFNPLCAQQQSNLLDKKITIRFREASIESCIKQLTRYHKVEFAYNPALFPDECRVTASFTNATMQQVINQVVSCAGLSVLIVKNKVVLYKPYDITSGESAPLANQPEVVSMPAIDPVKKLRVPKIQTQLPRAITQSSRIESEPLHRLNSRSILISTLHRLQTVPLPQLVTYPTQVEKKEPEMANSAETTQPTASLAHKKLVIGIVAGPHWGKPLVYNRQNEPIEGIKSQTGISMGLHAGWFPFRRWGLETQPVISLNRMAHNTKTTTTILQTVITRNWDITARHWYLEVPVLATVRFPIQQSFVFLATGPAYFYGLSGQITVNKSTLSSKWTGSNNTQYDANFSTFQRSYWAWTLQTGYQSKHWRFTIDVKRSLNDRFTDQSRYKALYKSGLTLTTGYLF